MIKLTNVWKEYPIDHEFTFVALNNINLSINEGEFVSVVGPSGCGKSTLMHILGLLDKPSRGKVMINDRDVSRLDDDQISTLRNEFVGFVFQQFNLIPKLTILENVLLPAIYARRKFTYSPNEYAFELLNKFGLSGKENSYPNKISGGQQQRVAIARALISKPQFILADEPTGNLDTKNGQKIIELLHDLNSREKITIVIVTHEISIAKRASRSIRMKDGKILSSQT